MTNHTLTAVTSITNAIREDQDRGSGGLSRKKLEVETFRSTLNYEGLIYETQPNSILSYNEEHKNAYGLVVILTAVATLKNV